MGLYESERAELLMQKEQLDEEVQKIEADFYEAYYRYNYLYEQLEKNPHDSRMISQFEEAEKVCESYEKKYAQVMGELEECESSIEDIEGIFWEVIDNMRDLDFFAREWYDNTYAPEKIRSAFFEYWGEEAETLLFE